MGWTYEGAIAAAKRDGNTVVLKYGDDELITLRNAANEYDWRYWATSAFNLVAIGKVVGCIFEPHELPSRPVGGWENRTLHNMEVKLARHIREKYSQVAATVPAPTVATVSYVPAPPPI